ncbi:MAG: hypothetical protein WBK48_10265 [Dethiobacteria bacterium]|jgi:uncharacterized coiled-coil protein SlyX|nr:hypothetical protein [Bacillota bacterium]
MPFVVDIYPASRELEAAAAMGLALSARKGKGFPGRRQYEPVEVLARFTLPLCTATWEADDESCTALLIDPLGLLSGSLRFDLPPDAPPQDPILDSVEEDFVALCRRLAKTAADVQPQVEEVEGLVAEAGQVQALLQDDDGGAEPAGLEETVHPDRVVEKLRTRLAEYDGSAAAWTQLKQNILAHRDKLVLEINAAADEARAAGQERRAELETQVKAALAAKSKETELAGDKIREEYRKQKELLQSELERFQQQFRETGDEYWREKIKEEERRLAENEKKLASALEQLKEEERRFAAGQQERIHLFEQELEKRLAAFEQRLKRLNSAVAAFEKGVDKRLERFREQQQRISALAVSLDAGQCDREFPVVFYAARYPGNRWQVFPPQLFGSRGLRGKVAGLLGEINLPFRPAGKVAEALAAKIQALLPGHDLESRLVEQNLLKDPAFLEQAKTGLARLIDQGAVDKKYAHLF